MLLRVKDIFHLLFWLIKGLINYLKTRNQKLCYNHFVNGFIPAEKLTARVHSLVTCDSFFTNYLLACLHCILILLKFTLESTFALVLN